MPFVFRNTPSPGMRRRKYRQARQRRPMDCRGREIGRYLEGDSASGSRAARGCAHAVADGETPAERRERTGARTEG